MIRKAQAAEPVLADIPAAAPEAPAAAGHGNRGRRQLTGRCVIERAPSGALFFALITREGRA